MSEDVADFYNDLAGHYHLLFEDWNRAIDRQARILNPLLGAQPGQPLRILDCACGIGTQALGFAQHGHSVTGSDLSPQAVARARQEALARGLDLAFHVADLTSLAGVPGAGFDVVAALDNALPHLAPDALAQALRAMAAKLRPGGLLLASIRDYDRLLPGRPAMQEPAFFGDGQDYRIVHQVWDWLDDRRYEVHLYLTLRAGGGWRALHFASSYRALLRAELTAGLHAAGFAQVQWLMPEQSGYYQPLVLAR